MKASELETEFWRKSLAAYYHPKGDFLAEGYAPPGGKVADFTIVRLGDEFHLFHIERRIGGNCAWPGHEIYFGHSSTSDFVSWDCHEPVLLVQPGRWDGGHVYAPFVFAHDGLFYMFYTGLNSCNAQQIGLATSPDLFHWTRHPNNPLICPRDFDWAFWSDAEPCSCRDPHVVRIGELFHLYYTAVTRPGDGCVALATSRNLIDWEDRGPVKTIVQDSNGLDEGSNHLESASVFERQGEFVLFYNHMHGLRLDRSLSPYAFGDTAGQIVWAGASGLEKVAEHDGDWLVAAFENRTERLILGVLDWRLPDLAVRRITESSEIGRFISPPLS